MVRWVKALAAKPSEDFECHLLNPQGGMRTTASSLLTSTAFPHAYRLNKCLKRS